MSRELSFLTGILLAAVIAIIENFFWEKTENDRIDQV